MQFIHRQHPQTPGGSKLRPLRASQTGNAIGKTRSRRAVRLGRAERPGRTGPTGLHAASAQPAMSLDRAGTTDTAGRTQDEDSCDWERWLFEGGDLLMGLAGEAAAL